MENLTLAVFLGVTWHLHFHKIPVFKVCLALGNSSGYVS